MGPIATSMFEFATAARPEQVWVVLTRPEETARYLYGLGLRSDWRAGSAIVADDDIGGEVLCAQPPCRLSYTLAAAGDQPLTCVTWEVEAVEGGTLVRLVVDETGPDSRDDIDEAWQPAVAALRARLAERP